MAEEQTNQEATTATATTNDTQASGGEAASSISASDVRSHDLFKRLTDELASMKQEQAAAAQAAEAAQAAKLKEKEQYKELASSLEAKLAEVTTKADARVAAIQREMVDKELRWELGRVGVTDDIAQLGYITKYANLEGDKPAPSEWIKSLKTENPERFDPKAATKGKPSGSAGVVHSGSGQSLDERLKSTDKRTFMQAWGEKLQGAV